MRIIKNALDTFKPFQITCANCKSILEVETLKDIDVHWSGQGEMGSYVATVTCPVCRRDNYLPNADHYHTLKESTGHR